MLTDSGEHKRAWLWAILGWALELTPGMCLGALVVFGFVAGKAVLSGHFDFAVIVALLAAFSGATAQWTEKKLERRHRDW